MHILSLRVHPLDLLIEQYHIYNICIPNTYTLYLLPQYHACYKYHHFITDATEGILKYVSVYQIVAGIMAKNRSLSLHATRKRWQIISGRFPDTGIILIAANIFLNHIKLPHVRALSLSVNGYRSCDFLRFVFVISHLKSIHLIHNE